MAVVIDNGDGIIGAGLDTAIAYKLRTELPANGIDAVITTGVAPDLVNPQRVVAAVVGLVIGAIVGYLVAR